MARALALASVSGGRLSCWISTRRAAAAIAAFGDALAFAAGTTAYVAKRRSIELSASWMATWLIAATYDWCGELPMTLAAWLMVWFQSVTASACTWPMMAIASAGASRRTNGVLRGRFRRSHGTEVMFTGDGS